MIEPLTRAALSTLVEAATGPTVSCYLPTHRTDPSPERDMAQLEQLLRPVPRLLREAGADEGSRESLLAPFHDFIAAPELWRTRDSALALFSGPSLWRAIRVPVDLAPRIEVGLRPLVAPLLAALPAEERFYVLALSANHVRVIEVAPGTIQCREVSGLPQDMHEALGYEQFQRDLQVHSATSRGLGRRQPLYHGHGDADEERLKNDVESYFRRVAQVLDAALAPEVPKVLATVEAYLPLYRKASRDGSLAPEAITGNPEFKSDVELAQRAREILTQRAEARVREEYRALKERDPKSTARGVDEVVTAACQGRIHALYINAEASSWGTYESDLCRVEVHGRRLAGDEDLIDLAVARTLAQGGKAVALPAAQVPGEPPVAAVLRF